eukprot:gnl/TRDRNA2_/TRDRNA2_200014_c0_seq1.p1 gnl/TRDRNA2_/TRDRNA2_200014_c0~~gnl/TRDRNA2_/TRDRNA2_200014_c0_seq1.p1  ORF type:complete len:292 (-),score=63.72 gnl/TRDRNA2_/TRDRNA2_200014_c0_seq1:38-913(-)
MEAATKSAQIFLVHDSAQDDADCELTFSVHLMSGEVLTVSMKATQRIQTMKRKIEEIDGTDREELRLVAGGSILSNRQTVGEVKALYGESLQLIKLQPFVNKPLEISGELPAEGVVPLEEEMSQEPTDEDVDNYMDWLGMDADEDQEYMWLAEEALRCPLPDVWRAYANSHGDVFYFNVQTSESTWLHPIDEHYKKLYRELKAQKQTTARPQIDYGLDDEVEVLESDSSLCDSLSTASLEVEAEHQCDDSHEEAPTTGFRSRFHAVPSIGKHGGSLTKTALALLPFARARR